ncbi:transglutaminase family protein [Hyalangium versicolor]|uniref:transglutaminase family protein n=1 Tax=Hyalangium versicolor TaxID=2861190 RepID=UPI001CCCC4F8|nr:transglutaminase domain-containing protein [Hyalangium versicolor]
MSEPAAPVSRVERGVELLPVLAALAFNAVAHDRWLMCGPAALLLVVLSMLGRQPPYSSRLLLISGVVGGTVGAVMSGMWPTLGPISPLIMGPLCGALVGLTTLCALCGRRMYALTYALLLSALSTAVRGSNAVFVGILVVALSLLVLIFMRGRMGHAGLAGGVAFGVFVLVLMGASFGMMRFLRASQGVLTDTLFRMVQSAPRLSGVAMQSEISLERQGRMSGAGQLVMELRGDRPERLRTSVFDTFDGTRWKTSQELEQTQLALTPPRPQEPLRSTELTLLQALRPYLPAPAGIRSIAGATPKVQGGWMLRGDGRKGVTLTLRHEQREQLPEEPPPDARLTALPEALRAELRPMALELTRGATTPRARAEALELWFRENYEYSLSVDLSGEGSPLAILIRERRPAWCTYFASAMAALLRSLDIPARMAGGFVPQEKNPFSEAFLIRDRDAHAWVEVYLPEEGRFVAFDPTPWRSREPLDAQAAISTWSAAWQAFSSGFRRWTERLLDSPLEALLAVVSFPLTWLVVGVGVAWRLVKRYRRERVPKARAAMRGTDPGLAAAYARYLRAMKRGANLVPAPTETDEELLNRLRTARGDRAGALAEAFIARYRQARYGGDAADPALLGKLTVELEQLLRQER